MRRPVQHYDGVYCIRCSCCGALFKRHPGRHGGLWFGISDDSVGLGEMNDRCLLCGGHLLNPEKKGGEKNV